MGFKTMSNDVICDPISSGRLKSPSNRTSLPDRDDKVSHIRYESFRDRLGGR